VYVSTHDRYYSHYAPYCYNYPSYWHHNHHHYWGHYWGPTFSIGFGWPYYSSYYSSYPYWYDPWWPHYRYGIYVGYSGYYNDYPYYGYGSSDTYVTNNYYSSPAPSETVETNAGTYIQGSGAAQAPALDSGSGDITPLPKAQPVELEHAGTAEAPPPVAEAAGGGAGAIDAALIGLTLFRDGRYADASDSLFAASVDDPASPVLKVYLAQSLFAIGEYKYSAEYLRQALTARPELALQDFSIGRLYAATPEGQTDMERHLAALKEQTSVQPYDADALLVLGFIQMNDGNTSGAGASLLAMGDAATNPANQAMALQLLGAAQVRSLPSGTLSAGGGDRAETALATGIETPPEQPDELGATLTNALY
jgi:tetratricopeptide (TPR) repeat protein